MKLLTLIFLIALAVMLWPEISGLVRYLVFILFSLLWITIFIGAAWSRSPENSALILYYYTAMLFVMGLALQKEMTLRKINELLAWIG
jgi:hypothetical protein